MKQKEEWKISGGVFDKSTETILQKLSNDGYLDYIKGIVATGKEADVFIGYNSEGKAIAVKIFRIETSHFKREKYIFGDTRFDKKQLSSGKRGVVDIWAKKEFKNLERAHKAGARVPRPIISRGNVLLMEFIGQDDKAAPLAKDVPPTNVKKWFKSVMDMVRGMYEKQELVHGDLSEFNLMNFNEEPVMIDFGQGVLKDHPLANELLLKDIINLIKWFRHLGIETPEAKSIYNEIKKEDK